MELNNAVEIVVKHIKEDPDYRRTWQANIAMSFKDQYAKQASVLSSTDAEREEIFMIANKAADNFLDNLVIDIFGTNETPSPHLKNKTRRLKESLSSKVGRAFDSLNSKIVDEYQKGERDVLRWLLGSFHDPINDKYYGKLIKQVNDELDEPSPEKVPMETPDPEPLKKTEV